MHPFNCSSDHIFCSKSYEDSFYTTSLALACQIAAISFLIFTSLCGNTLLCYAIYKTSSKMSASSFFIINLAVTDILVGSLVLPFWILSTATLSRPVSNGVCEFTAFLTMTLMQCSIYSLSGIAVDRYFSISHPLRYPIEATMSRVAFVILGIWAFCLCVASFPIYGWGDYRFQPQTVPICNPEYISQVSFTIFLILFGMALPFAIMLFSYIRIVQIARNHIQKIESLQNTLAKPQTHPHQFVCVSGQNSSINRRASKFRDKPNLSSKFAKNVKAVRKVLVAVGVFFLCWGPYVILNFWSVNNEHVPVPYIADLLTTLLAFANSAVNPVIFIILNKDLRNVIKKLDRRVFCFTTAATNVTNYSDLVTYVAEKSDHRVRCSPVLLRNNDPLTLRVNSLDIDDNNSSNDNTFVREIKYSEANENHPRQGEHSRVRFGSNDQEPTLPGSV